MQKTNKKNSKKNNNENKYNAENEIIIGVTTKPKESVRVEKKPTRTNAKTTQTKTKKTTSNIANKNKGNTVNNKNAKNNKAVKPTNNVKKVKANNNKRINSNINRNKVIKKNNITKEERIKKINTKKIIISIFVLILIVLGGTIYYLTTPVFNISNIEIYGNEKNTVETYISLSKIDIGTTNIFAITENKIKNNIKENSYVENVTIKRKLPNNLEIHITERKVAYQIEYADSYIYLDNQGYILEISEEKKAVTIVNGMSITHESIKIGHRLEKEDLIKLNVVAKIINYCKYNSIENKITSIDVTDDANYIVYFKKDKKTVYLGDATNLSERLSLLKTILKNEEKSEIEIFMNGNLNEDEVYIRYVEK